MRWSKWFTWSNTFSACRQIFMMVSTVSTGKRPRSVSAPSRMPSAPSSTTFATSVASALCGRYNLGLAQGTGAQQDAVRAVQHHIGHVRCLRPVSILPLKAKQGFITHTKVSTTWGCIATV